MESSTRPVEVVIVAADPLVRSSLALLLENTADCEVVLLSGPQLFLSGDTEAQDAAPDAALVVWDMGWESGQLEGFDFWELELPVVSLVANEDQAVEAWGAGARAILSRECAAGELLAALIAVAQGLVVFDPVRTSALLPSPPRFADDLPASPTTRELEVLQLLAEGLTNRAIAQTLDISEHTVKFHVNAILTKLDAQSRTEAVVTATRLGFIVL
jgi:two-component system nitrate/nitrite response regulator NarL